VGKRRVARFRARVDSGAVGRVADWLDTDADQSVAGSEDFAFGGLTCACEGCLYVNLETA